MATQHAASSAKPLEPVRFEELGTLLIAGMRERYTFDTLGDIPSQWRRWAPHIADFPGRVGDFDYGVCYTLPDGNGVDYLSGVQVRDGAALHEKWSCVSIPAHRYAVFAHAGHVSELCNTIDAIWRVWLPTSGCEAAGDDQTPAFFERYDETFDPQAGVGGIEVWLPIR